MNVQQLNATGQQMKVVIFTALISMFITGMLWLAVARINNTRQWLLKGEEFTKQQGEPNYSIDIRLIMLYYLVFHRNKGRGSKVGLLEQIRWVFRSNVWVHILLNNPSNDIGQRYDVNTHISTSKHWAAGHFAAYYVREGLQGNDYFEQWKWESPWRSSM